MFAFVVKHLGFLKHVPLFPQLFDTLLKLGMYFKHPDVLDQVDALETEIRKWPEISVQNHKYGGIQFNRNRKEIGHIHGNGLMDILFSRKIKSDLMREGRICDHHVFRNSGWVSFYIRTLEDSDYALGLLKRAYEGMSTKPD